MWKESVTTANNFLCSGRQWSTGMDFWKYIWNNKNAKKEIQTESAFSLVFATVFPICQEAYRTARISLVLKTMSHWGFGVPRPVQKHSGIRKITFVTKASTFILEVVICFYQQQNTWQIKCVRVHCCNSVMQLSCLLAVSILAECLTESKKSHFIAST